jgi:hypothetical protein
MNLLNLGLRQFASIPERTTLLVSGGCATGKTTFAAYVAKVALEGGQKVTFIDPDHSFGRSIGNRKALSVAVTEMCQSAVQPGAELHYQSLPDMIPYRSADLMTLIEDGLGWADLLIVDDMPRAFYHAADAEQHPEAWNRAAHLIGQRVRDNQRGARAVVTYTAGLPPLGSAARLPRAIDQDKNDPISLMRSRISRLYPVPTEHDPENHVMAIEMRKVFA